MWWWVLIWLLLVLGSLAVLALVTWRVLVRPAIALGRQMSASADEIAVALAPVRENYRPAHSVLVDPSAAPDASQRRSGGARRSNAR